MSNFTPGPWEAKQKYIGISVFDSNGDGVANVCQSYGDTPYKVWANARLIAAAPEMYELLREFLQGLGDFITERKSQMRLLGELRPFCGGLTERRSKDGNSGA